MDDKPKLLQVKIINTCVDADKMIEAILSELDYPSVDIIGGEFFLNFDVLLKILKAIRTYKEYIIVNTNGSLLSPVVLKN